jgi:hypothetical protein
MQCPKCGLENPPSAVWCDCGYDFQKQAMRPAEQTNPQTNPQLRGVEGWLLLFCVSLTILGPLINLVEILQNPNDAFIAVFDVALSAFSIYTGAVVWGVRSSALKLVKVYFIVALAVAALSILASFRTGLQEIQQQSPAQNPIMVGGRIFIAVAIWWSYFKKSKRVRATFGMNL